MDNFPYRHIQQVDFGLEKLDYIGRYENLDYELDVVFNTKVNKENTTKHNHYSFSATSSDTSPL